MDLETHFLILGTVLKEISLSEPVLCSTIISQGQSVNLCTLDTT